MLKDRKSSGNIWDQRPNIGLLGDAMHSEQGFWAGAADAAEAHGVNLYVFLGGAVMPGRLKPSIRYGLMGIEVNVVLYDLVDVNRMDGLITWAGAGAGLGGLLSPNEMDAFFRHYHPLPIVNYEKVVEGIPSVLTDTAQGMRELLIHMIEIHGSRRIALLRGQPGHFENDERHRAYSETLTEYGLPLNSDLVCTTDEWDFNQGRDMIRSLMDERGLRAGQDFDTVIATEGQFGISAIRELRARGIQMPETVRVAAYNDLTEARAIIPSLTVMRKSFYNAGQKSLEILLDLIGGKPVPDQTLVPSELLIRRSCGCWPRALQQFTTQKPLNIQPDQPQTRSLPTQSIEATLTDHRDEILAALTQGIGVLTPSTLASELASSLFNALLADITNESDSSNQFNSALETAVQTMPVKAQEIEQWHSILATLQHYTILYLVDDLNKRFRVENLWQQARIVIQFEAQRRELEYGLEDLLLTLQLRETDRRLMDTFDMPELLDTIAQLLPNLGIPACFLSLFEEPQAYSYPQVVPEWSRLILGFDERGRVNLPPDGERFRSRLLIPDTFSPPDKVITWILVPLYIQQRQYGFALLETGPKKGMLYTEIWQLISNALKVVFLMKERLELAVERERVAILSNFIRDAGHEFRTPLSIISSSLYLLTKQIDTDKRTMYLERLKTQSTHVQTLVEAMLTMSRLDSSSDFVLTTLNVADLLQELYAAMRPLADDKQIALVVEVADDLPYIRGDQQELFTALSLIVENAIRYTGSGGKIHVRAHASRESVIVEVADTGIGISEANLPRIFERFFRVDQARTDRGAGLGLSIAKKIIEVHHGSIEVASVPEQGSIFKVILPYFMGRQMSIEQEQVG